MPENKAFPPEGLRPSVVCTMQSLKQAAESGEILEALALRCDVDHTLHFSLNGIRAIMERGEVNAPWISGAERDIAILSRVGKPTCFTAQEVFTDEKGAPVARLSRRTAQEKAMDHFLQSLRPGSVLTCRVTRLESFGVFLDMGCGIIAMLPIEHISVSRISHTKERFRTGQKLLAAVLSVDQERRRFTMTHRELPGTWMANTSWFRPGATAPAAARSVQPYGSFIELTPNLSGLADSREDLTSGDRVSVYIKSIRPERMKIKLQVIEKLPPDDTLPPLKYQITDGILDRWIYSPPNYEKAPVETVFLENS